MNIDLRTNLFAKTEVKQLVGMAQSFDLNRVVLLEQNLYLRLYFAVNVVILLLLKCRYSCQR